MNRTRIGLLTIALVAAQPASAALITYSADFYVSGFVSDPSEPIRYTGETSFNRNTAVGATLQRFDPALGMLTGVEISMTSRYYNYVHLLAVDDDFDFTFPPYDSSAAFDLVRVMQVRRTDPASLTRTLFAPLSGSCSDDSFFDVSSCDLFGNTGPGAGDFDVPWLLSGLGAGPLSSYAGSNPLDFEFSLAETLNLDCDSNDDGDRCYLMYAVGDWSGSITASYTYTPFAPPGGGDGGGPGPGPVPVDEPSILALLGLGLAALGLGKRRFARRSRS